MVFRVLLVAFVLFSTSVEAQDRIDLAAAVRHLLERAPVVKKDVRLRRLVDNGTLRIPGLDLRKAATRMLPHKASQ